MAKRRTRKEKTIARLRRQLKRKQSQTPKKSRKADTALPKLSKEPKKEKNKLSLYNPSLIKRDLTKTGAYSVLLTAIILGLYWYFELGGQTLIARLFQFLPF